MGHLVVQQFVSADGFAANDENERLIPNETQGGLGAADYAVFSASHR